MRLTHAELARWADAGLIAPLSPYRFTSMYDEALAEALQVIRERLFNAEQDNEEGTERSQDRAA